MVLRDLARCRYCLLYRVKDIAKPTPPPLNPNPERRPAFFEMVGAPYREKGVRRMTSFISFERFGQPLPTPTLTVLPSPLHRLGIDRRREPKLAEIFSFTILLDRIYQDQEGDGTFGGLNTLQSGFGVTFHNDKEKGWLSESYSRSHLFFR